MANPVTRAQITFSRAAVAAGLTEKTLRGWLDRGQVILEGDAEREEGAWRRFSILDVVRLAIIGRVVRYGFEVRTAYEIVASTVDGKLRLVASYRNTPPSVIPAALQGLVIVLAYVDGKRVLRIGYSPADRPDVSDLGDFLTVVPAMIADEVVQVMDLVAAMDHGADD
jgi:hypothetical protein